jgi:hypothetical protein
MLVGRHVFDRSAARRCLLATAASGGMWAVALAARPLGPAASLAAGVATLFVLVAAFRIVTPDEIALVRAGLWRLRRRLPSRTG